MDLSRFGIAFCLHLLCLVLRQAVRRPSWRR